MTRSVAWTPLEDAEILRLRDDEGLAFDEIVASLPGRTIDAIKLRYYSKLRSRSLVGQGILRKRGRRRRKIAPEVYVEPPAPPLQPVDNAGARPPSVRRVSTYVLVADAELRARIALQGLTAGIFGDPPPGRSALDEKKRGGS